MVWTLWVSMMVELRGCKRKGDPQQKSHHEIYVCDEKMDHNTDNIYDQEYTPEKHTQQIVQSTQYAHEVQAKHSMCIQKLGDGHSEVYQEVPHQDICQTVWKTVVY